MKTDETVRIVKSRCNNTWTIFEHYKIIAVDRNSCATALLPMFLNYPQKDLIHERSRKKSNRHLGNKTQTLVQKNGQDGLGTVI